MVKKKFLIKECIQTIKDIQSKFEDYIKFENDIIHQIMSEDEYYLINQNKAFKKIRKERLKVIKESLDYYFWQLYRED